MSFHHLGTVADPPMAAAIAMSEGAFRMGAAAMRDAAEERVRQAGNHLLAARVAEVPIPVMPEPRRAAPEEWGWWAGTSEEFYDIDGPLPSREAAIAAGRQHQCGEAFYIIEAQLKRYEMPSADSVIGLMLDDSDVVYEDCAEMNGPKDECRAAEAELDALLSGWIERHAGLFSAPTAFGATRNGEVVPGECPDCGGDCGEDCPADPAAEPVTA